MLRNTELDSWLLSLWRLCQFETFLPDAPHQRGLLRRLMIYFSGKLWKGRTVTHLSENFSGQSPVGSLKDKWTDLKRAPSYAVTDWWEQAELGERNLKSFISIVTRRQEPLYERLQGCFWVFLFPVFLFYTLLFYAYQQPGRQSQGTPETLFTRHCYTSVSKASFEGSNQIK